MNITELRNKIEETDINYIKINFPIKHEGYGIFRSHNNLLFKFALSGVGYLSERNTRFSYKSFTQFFYDKNWEGLEMQANKAMNMIKGQGKGLILAIYNGECVGVLKHYNNVSHKELLDLIQDAGLSPFFVNGYLGSQFMSFDIKQLVHRPIYLTNQEKVEIALRVTNGHSGHKALSYSLVVKSLDYEFAFPHWGSSRHLTGVSEFVSTIKNIVEEMRNIAIDIKLAKMTVSEFMIKFRKQFPETTGRQERLLQLLENAEEVYNGLDSFVFLSQYADSNGYKSAVKSILDSILMGILTD